MISMIYTICINFKLIKGRKIKKKGVLKMKRVIFLALLTLLVISNPVYADQTVYVNYQSVNIRTYPNTGSNVIRSVPLGEALKVLEETERWYKVKLKDNTMGWIYKTMVINDIPAPIKIVEIESKLEGKTRELEDIKSKFEAQAALNAELDKNLKEIQLELDKSVRKNREFERQHDLKLAAIGIIILLLGWAAGYVTGFLKRQTEDKRLIKMMIEANSLKKVSNSSI
jgi:uncharacterized protein YgiM (DUF1202 family)